eukprot:2912102-Prymnesium_polylepis.1
MAARLSAAVWGVAAVARRPRSDPGIAVSGFPVASTLTGVGSGTRTVGSQHYPLSRLWSRP